MNDEAANVTALEIFYDPPKTEVDPDQATLRSVLANLRSKGVPREITMRGFWASHVDLGWLVKRSREWWVSHETTWSAFGEKIGAELEEVVQRLKDWHMELDDQWLVVSFETKDDRSWYSYTFAVYLGLDDRDEEDLEDDVDVGIVA